MVEAVSQTLLDGPGRGAGAAAGDWTCATCGSDIERACAQLTHGCRIDAAVIIRRLEQAGATLLALRGRSPFPAPFRSCMPDPIQDVMEAYGYTEAESLPALPSAREISRMDVSYAWLGHIPAQRRVIRRIVAARSLVDPLSGRHVVSWRRLGILLRASHVSVEVWHGQGIATIVANLCSPP